MKHSHSRILTTHVGSLARPNAIREVMRARELELPYDEGAFKATLKTAVRKVVGQQASAGIDIVNDGEFSKTGWIRYVAERMSGFVHREVRAGEKDGANLNIIGEVEKFPEFYAAYAVIQEFDWLAPDQSNTAPGRKTGELRGKKLVWDCTGPIAYRGQEVIARDIANLKNALAQASSEEAFLPVAAPHSARGLWHNSYYPDEDSVLVALADALRQEYLAIVDAGLILQIDDAFLADQYAGLSRRLGEKGANVFLESRIELLNHALRGIPEDRIRYHICWGSWHGPHTTDVPLKTLLPLIFQVRAQAYSIEAANPRHEHEWQVWKDVKLPEGKILIPGFVSHSTNVVEHPELIAWRIGNFASVVGRENLIAGTDCGFSQSYSHLRVHPSIQWAKLSALAEGARLASRQLWPSRAG